MHVEHRQSVEELQQENNSVLIKLSGSAEPSSYDVVIGADGIDSRIRGLIFSKEVNKSYFRNIDTYATY